MVVALSNKIRELRFNNGEMTQKRLGELVGVSRQTMNVIENSKHAPTIDVAIRIADVFGVSVDDLFECAYDGKQERRPEATRTAAVRKRASIDRTINDSAEHGSAEEEARKEITLADLRNVVG